MTKLLPTNLYPKESNLYIFRFVKKEINCFLKKKINRFTFTCKLEGTSFQKKVWNQVKKIKYGKTLSYMDIANKINSSPRAVGNACSKNKCLLIIPCHRVICYNGNIGGYVMGSKIKSDLLKLEKNE